jgi:SAM-dependent methyltransferase
MNTERLFDTYADVYQEKFIENPIAIYQRNLVYKSIEPFLKNRGKILDIGCGPGSDFAFYKSHDLTVDAIDISERMVNLARQSSEKLNFPVNICHSSLQSFSPGSTYDAIILNFGVINVFDNLEEILQKLASMLDQQGFLIVVLMPPFHLFFIFELLAKLQFSLAFRRLFRHEAILENGFKISYYRSKDFRTLFKPIKKRNLAALLPTPDQYSRWAWARGLTRILLSTDKWISTRIPEILGGDHVCYILKHSSA